MTAGLTDADASALAALVASAVREILQSTPPLPEQLMFNPKQASALTGIPERWLREKANSGEIPSRKPGLYRLFSLEDLETIVAAYEQKPTHGPVARFVRRSAKSQAA